MRLKALAILFIFALAAAASSVSAANARSNAGDRPDAITGEWDASFTLQGYPSIPVALEFKLDGDKVTGKISSEHTGPGTFKGTFVDNKLDITCDFAKHESIAVSGELKDGRLAGEFRTEGMQGTWEAKKK